MANDEVAALDALEKEAKEYDKARSDGDLFKGMAAYQFLGCRD